MGKRTPKELRTSRQLAGSMGGHLSWAHTDDRTARTANGRRTFMERFEREVDPDGKLPPKERAMRAEHAKKAYFAALTLRSIDVRRRNAAARRSA